VSDIPKAISNPPTPCLNAPKGNHTPRHTGNTTNDLTVSHMHCPAGRIVPRHPFVDHIMEADIPLGWKPFNLERYDGTTNPNEHLDAFLTQANLYTIDDAILCRVFPTFLKGATLTWYGGLPPRSIDSFNTLFERFNALYATSRSHYMTLAALASLRQADDESLRKLMDKFERTAV